MANTNRQAKSYLDQLTHNHDELLDFEFESLLRYLEANAPLSERIGYSISPKQDVARFGQTPLMHFYSSAFTEISKNKATGDHKVKNSYWGMLGINGPLPLHFTEYAIERNFRHQDATFNEFLDIFNHRFISLFYRAWADAEPAVSHDRPEQDHFQQNLAALAGEPELEEEAFFKQPVSQYLSGLLSQKNRSPRVLSQLLAEYLQLPVSIDEFVGRWYELNEQEVLKLGHQNASLGHDAMLGQRTYQACFNFKINIGPLDYDEYIRLVDDKQYLKMLDKLVRRAVGQEFEYQISISLKPQQTRTSHLGRSKLGINSWSQSELAHLQQCAPITVYQTASC
ncbi:type VI secretion system baseplate subunit TssG [Catenovulum sp. SM1970]|uniref:type VI secretion system baseplate subunit TssG n=1 Tax=Marinifaba aquimaris TaxID=2741323 RepID=UPI001573AF30|nr:type VI secretion system baseplate subunit TssG [Marinifaba aquimaris]NTS75650.1 type VI secretion system baseplate subunit TssG [Marinifaba aquimaris]